MSKLPRNFCIARPATRSVVIVHGIGPRPFKAVVTAHLEDPEKMTVRRLDDGADITVGFRHCTHGSA